ncbi:unnamed protein product [Ilex paraguariensis]|uniref:DUF4283 domain-containing protein n=1 Tax=Ilex paraguariensis TaxID=185542 RepID=A0ABC8V5Q2_9AQUA
MMGEMEQKSYLEVAKIGGRSTVHLSVFLDKNGVFGMDVASCLVRCEDQQRSLVGRFNVVNSKAPTNEKFIRWANSNWGLVGQIFISMVNSLFMFVFQSVKEAKRILHMQDWFLACSPLHLDSWVQWVGLEKASSKGVLT